MTTPNDGGKKWEAQIQPAIDTKEPSWHWYLKRTICKGRHITIIGGPYESDAAARSEENE